MQDFGMSMLWFWVCYAIVTCVGILHTIFNIYVLKMKPMTKTVWAKVMRKQNLGIPCITSFCSLCSVGYI